MNTVLLRPLLPAFAAGMPRPRQARLTDRRAGARVAGRPDRPLPVAAALVTGGLDRIRLAARATPRSPPPSSAAARWAVPSAIGVGLSLALFLAALRWMPPLPSWEALSAGVQLPAESANAEPAATEPEAPASEAAVADRQSIEAAINEELHRYGASGIHVTLADDGSMRVAGQAISTAQRDEVLQWLRALPGAGEIEDAVSVTRPAPPAPAPAADAAPRAAPAVPDAPPNAGTMPQAAIPPPSPPAIAAPHAPPAPDAGQLARALRRELARLGLAEVVVDVDPSTLDITLRGKTGNSAAKAQLLAAARAAAPGSRVRDLVFVIEE